MFQLSFPDKEWGTYFISVKDKESKHSTGVMSYFDWPYNEGRRNTDGSESATMLSFKTDKDSYTPGEKMVVTFPSTKGSRAIICIENGVRVLSLTEHTCEDKQTTVRLDVTKDMQPNAYVYITLCASWHHEERFADPLVWRGPVHGNFSGEPSDSGSSNLPPS